MLGPILETLIGGLLTGVLYSLVALGFVLIFKASGVFNFAQGAMVLFAALSLARLSEVMPFALALALSVLIMIALAYAIEFLVLRRLVNQEGIILFMATLGITYFLDGFGQSVWGSDIYKIDLGFPRDPIFILESVFPGGLLIDPTELIAAIICAAMVAGAGGVLPGDAGRARAARGRRRPPGGAVGRHPAQPDLADGVGGVGHRRAGRRHDLGRQARRAVLDLAGRPQGAAGADPRRLHLDSRARSSAG